MTNRLLSKVHSLVKIVLFPLIFITLICRLDLSRLIRVIQNCKQFLKTNEKIADLSKQSEFRKKSNKPLYYREWVIIFILISSILTVMIVGTIKKNVIKNRLHMVISKELSN